MAIFNSSSINRNGFPRGVGVYPVKDVGTITIASNTTLTSTTTDTLRICYIPQNCFISDYKIVGPALDSTNTLRWSLQDSLASPTTYMANTVITVTSASWYIQPILTTIAGVTVGNWGTQYGATARTIGTAGTPVVVWASGVQLRLLVSTTAGATSGATAINISYMVEFSPCYDMGV